VTTCANTQEIQNGSAAKYHRTLHVHAHVRDTCVRTSSHLRQGVLDVICAECKMNKYTNDILNTCNPEKQDWIPVTERLPEIRESVLITLWDRTITVGQWYGHRWGHAKAYQEDVLAWMPLPIPFH